MALQQDHELSETETANRLFFERVQEIPGVVLIEPYGGRTMGEQSFRVYLRNNDLEAENSVYKLQAEIYGRYPSARLDITVLEESDIIEGIDGCRTAAPDSV